MSIFVMNGISKTTVFKYDYDLTIFLLGSQSFDFPSFSFRLSDGKCIQNCSATLFQLVTACCSGQSMALIISSFPEDLRNVDSSLVDVLADPMKKVCFRKRVCC